MTTVVISASPERDYSFLAPITALFWRDVIGFVPIALLTGNEREWRSTGPTPSNRYPDGTWTAIEAFRHHGIKTTFAEIPANPGWQASTWSQVIRLHAAANQLIPSYTWVMMSDADLWPLRRDFYQQHERSPVRLVSYYSNGDHFFGKGNALDRFAARLPFQTLPMCHLAMRAGEWRSLMDIRPEDSISSSTTRALDRYFAEFMDGFAGPDRGLAVWCADQYLVTQRLCSQEWFPDDAMFIQRRGHPPVDRLCRGNRHDWHTGPFNADRWVDAHVHKAPEEPAQWATLLPIIDALMPQHSTWARAYHAEYTRGAQ